MVGSVAAYTDEIVTSTATIRVFSFPSINYPGTTEDNNNSKRLLGRFVLYASEKD